jgi:transcriptional regulator with XRE-family HTH domain
VSAAEGLGPYLRARRETIRPEEVGLPPGSRRKVAGLRREELALLAGISADYYLRLEQGRDRHPSPQVLDALARALKLDADSAAYLHDLATPKPARHARRPQRLATGTRLLLDQLPMPAFVQDEFYRVLGANLLGRALSPHYRPGVNLLRALFLDPAERELRADWDRATREAVAGLRAMSVRDSTDPRLAALVGELSVQSDRFRQLWAKHDVRRRTGGVSKLVHPQVGPLELRHEKLAVLGSEGQVLVVYHAERGSPSAQALDLLGSIAVTLDE